VTTFQSSQTLKRRDQKQFRILVEPEKAMSLLRDMTTKFIWISIALVISPCQAQVSLYEAVKSMPEDLLTFSTALDLAGLDSSSYLNRNGSNPITVLAPNNQAFESVSGKYLEPEWNNFLTAVLESPRHPFIRI
jgi:uncharacterized surface protein with fasciclin (FAS1) repeats